MSTIEDMAEDFIKKPLSNDVKLFFPGEKLSNQVAKVANVAGQDFTDAKLIIDKALIDAVENPGVMGSPEFIAAVNLISTNQALWFEYRSKIKSAKPSGVPMSEIDNMGATQAANGDRQDSAAAELIELVMGKGELFYDSRADKAFLSAEINHVMHTLAIGSKAFIDWLSYTYYAETKNGDLPGKSANESAIKQAGFALSGIAKHDGKEERVHLRVADKDGGHYIFVGDENMSVIEVLPTGWGYAVNDTVKFWMPGAMQSLPIPIRDGDLNQLWDFVNIPEENRLLVLAWMLECFRAETPFPILALTGTQGCAKSSTQDKIRQLIDNNSVNLRGAPKTVEDVFVAARCGWLSSYENLSHLPPSIQDACCTISTGGGHSGRQLYTNDEENIIDVKRPIICNSIPSVLTAQDVTDRAITLELPRIEYREESEINAAWDKAKPSIFGGLLDLFVLTLAMMPKVVLVNPPRMADFTRLGEAMAQSLGHVRGTFDTLYKANRAEGVSRALESSPVAVAVMELVDDHTSSGLTVFFGTMKGLLEALEKYKQDSNAWPRSGKGLGDALRRQQPALSSLGIEIISTGRVERVNGSRGITVTIKKGGNFGNIGNLVSDLSTPKEKFTPLNSVAFEDSEAF
ncbi:MAG: hypothetical protein RLZZ419_1635 [Pseudomonadota bacterium]|jgi:hypothetical protein